MLLSAIDMLYTEVNSQYANFTYTHGIFWCFVQQLSQLETPVLFAFLGLFQLSVVVFSWDHFVASDKISFFLWLHGVLYCIWCLFYRYHIFFIHSLNGWHLDCFYILVIVNYVGINMGLLVTLLCRVYFIWKYSQKWDGWII